MFESCEETKTAYTSTVLVRFDAGMGKFLASSLENLP